MSVCVAVYEYVYVLVTDSPISLRIWYVRVIAPPSVRSFNLTNAIGATIAALRIGAVLLCAYEYIPSITSSIVGITHEDDPDHMKGQLTNFN